MLTGRLAAACAAALSGQRALYIVRDITAAYEALDVVADEYRGALKVNRSRMDATGGAGGVLVVRDVAAHDAATLRNRLSGYAFRVVAIDEGVTLPPEAFASLRSLQRWAPV